MTVVATDRLVRNSAFTLGGHAAATVVAIVALPITFRTLGTERFALLMLLWGIIAYATLFDLGIGRAVARFTAGALARDEARKVPAILQSAMLLQVAIGIIAAVGLVGAAPLFVRGLHIPAQHASDVYGAIYVVALTVPVLLVTQSQNGFLEAFERFDLVAYVRTPVSIATYAIPAVGALLSWSLTMIFAGLLVARVAALAVLYVLCRTLTTHGAESIARAELLEMLRFGGWLSVSAFAIALMLYLDRFLIAALGDLNDVAQYTAPYDLAAKLLIIPGSIATVLFPTFSKDVAWQQPEAARQRMRRATRMIVLIMVPIAALLVVLADSLLRLWLGSQITAEGVTVFRILMLATVLHAVAYAPVVLIEGLGRSDAVAKYHLIELPIYVIVLLICINFGGIVGAAWAWVFRSVWAVGWSYWYAWEAR